MTICLGLALLSASCELPNLLLHQIPLRLKKLCSIPRSPAKAGRRGKGFTTHPCHHGARGVANLTSPHFSRLSPEARRAKGDSMVSVALSLGLEHNPLSREQSIVLYSWSPLTTFFILWRYHQRGVRTFLPAKQGSHPMY